MKVQTINLDNNKIRYMVIDENGNPILSAAKYLKHLDNINYSSNTQKTYANLLKFYFEFLKEIDVDYRSVNIQILSEFVAWLREPKEYKDKSIQNTDIFIRSNRTINLIISVVTNFYDYLYRSQDIKDDIVEKLLRQIITLDKKNRKTNVLALKIKKRKVQTLSQEEVEKIFNSAVNIRDKFLINLLYETGFRIGEALSLHIEDLVFDMENGHKIKLVDRGELENGAHLKSGERTIDISQDLMDLFDDYAYIVLDELDIDSNFLFVKLTGENKGKPLEYTDVNDLFRRIKKKTGIDVHAHLFRHTHATLYQSVTKDIKQLQERLGHASISTTMNLYLHPSSKEIRKNWDAVENNFKIKKF